MIVEIVKEAIVCDVSQLKIRFCKTRPCQGQEGFHCVKIFWKSSQCILVTADCAELAILKSRHTWRYDHDNRGGLLKIAYWTYFRFEYLCLQKRAHESRTWPFGQWYICWTARPMERSIFLGHIWTPFMAKTFSKSDQMCQIKMGFRLSTDKIVKNY